MRTFIGGLFLRILRTLFPDAGWYRFIYMKHIPKRRPNFPMTIVGSFDTKEETEYIAAPTNYFYVRSYFLLIRPKNSTLPHRYMKSHHDEI